MRLLQDANTRQSQCKIVRNGCNLFDRDQAGSIGDANGLSNRTVSSSSCRTHSF